MDDWWEGDPTKSLEVYPAEPTFTGLLDATGTPIMRLPLQVGFLSDHQTPRYAIETEDLAP